MKSVARLFSVLALMVFVALPAVTSAKAMVNNEVALEVVADAPEGEEKDKKECAKECAKECCTKKAECDKAEKKACCKSKEASTTKEAATEKK